jgi:hypothetical protein
LEHWALKQDRDQPDRELYRIQSHWYRYYPKQREIDANITTIIENAIKYQRCCRQIQRVWITRRYIPKLRAARIISRVYTSYLLRTTGSQRSTLEDNYDSDSE